MGGGALCSLQNVSFFFKKLSCLLLHDARGLMAIRDHIISYWPYVVCILKKQDPSSWILLYFA